MLGNISLNYFTNYMEMEADHFVEEIHQTAYGRSSFSHKHKLLDHKINADGDGHLFAYVDKQTMATGQASQSQSRP